MAKDGNKSSGEPTLCQVYNRLLIHQLSQIIDGNTLEDELLNFEQF